jgi:hypothetical protein
LSLLSRDLHIEEAFRNTPEHANLRCRKLETKLAVLQFLKAQALPVLRAQA